MRARTKLAWLLVPAAVILAPRPAVAWGFTVHHVIADRAIDLLPAAIRPFYRKHRVFIVEHAVDPDLWRSAGFVDEAPRHFLDLDAYGEYPYDGLPRDWQQAVDKFGEARLTRNGLLPWRTAEFADRLVKAFRRQRRVGGAVAVGDITFFSAVVSHYVSDAYVPFHAVRNYDGQLTDQRGIHARFESELFRRYAGELTIRPALPSSVARPRDAVFDALAGGARLVQPILDADRRAVAGRAEYDAAYFDRFLAGVRPLLERRIAASITAVAGVITGAWNAGGRPGLPLDPPRSNRKVRRRRH